MASNRISHLTKVIVALGVIALFVTFKLFDAVKERNLNIKTEAEESNLTSPLKENKKEFMKIFHLDLKGSPPKLSFLRSVLPLVKEAGANAILIEYEDMFPFYGKLRNVSARNAYSLREVRRLVELVEGLKMEAIPLVQTFGHLEYVLKLEEFQHLREQDAFPQEICPSRKESLDLVKELIRQVMEVHRNSRYIHIGCDEIRHLGVCPRCSREKPQKIFSSHVNKVATHVRSHFPKVTPLIWDDMLRRWTFVDMVNSGLGSTVEPVVWVYGNNIFLLVPPFVWRIYMRTFPRLWTASAFKGAFGEKEVLPNLTLHLENTLSWKRLISGKQREVSFPSEVFSGIFLTGWSRYDHFAVLCELLPVGIPSLLLNLVSYGPSNSNVQVFRRWFHLLNCPRPFLEADAATIQKETLFQSKLGECSFPGSNLYSGISQFLKLRTRLGVITRKLDSSGWFSRFNLNKNFTSGWRLREILPDEGDTLRTEISIWKASFFPLLTQYFDEWTASEWKEQNVTPMEEKLRQIQSDFRALTRRRTWPRRPLR